jgi:hypothetical protein
MAALLLACGPAKASAQWTPPTPDQLGFAYYFFLECTHEASGTSALPALFAYSTIAPFGANAATYAFCHSSLLNESNPPFYSANSLQSFYIYLAYIHARENFQNPWYAEQLEAFFTSYGQMVHDYYIAVSLYNAAYWKAGCDYYQSLIFPSSNSPAGQGSTSSGSSTTTFTQVSGGTLQISGGNVVHGAGVVDVGNSPGFFPGLGLGDFSTNNAFRINSP